MSNIIEVIQNPDGSWTASGGSSITVVRVTCLTRQKAVTRLDAALQAISALNNRTEIAEDSLRLENQRITPAPEPLHPHNDGLDEYRQPVQIGELDPAQRLALARGEEI